jgi:hypothetical protein
MLVRFQAQLISVFNFWTLYNVQKRIILNISGLIRIGLMIEAAILEQALKFKNKMNLIPKIEVHSAFEVYFCLP